MFSPLKLLDKLNKAPRKQDESTGQFFVDFPGKEGAKSARSGGYATWHFSKQDIAEILNNWDKGAAVWEWRSKFRSPEQEGRIHPSAMARKDVPAPIRQFIKENPAQVAKILYHGAGQDNHGAAALKNIGQTVHVYDPYQDPANPRDVWKKDITRLPKEKYDQIHSHYTLNVVNKSNGKRVLQEIHNGLNDGGKAVISVRRDLDKTLPNTSMKKSFTPFQLLEKLQKSGQYIKLPDWMLRVGNTVEALPSTQQNQAKRTFESGGKIDPKDIETIINNRNFQLTRALVDGRRDLTREQLMSIIDRKDGFNFGHTQPLRNQRGDFYKKLLNNMKRDYTNFYDDLIQNASTTAVHRLINHGDSLNDEHKFNIITQRRDLAADTLRSLIEKHRLGPEHIAELVHNPNHDVIIQGLRKLHQQEFNEADITPIIDAAIAKNDPKLTAKIFDSSNNLPVTDRQIQHVLESSQDTEALQHVARLARTPEHINYVLSNLNKFKGGEALNYFLTVPYYDRQAGDKHENINKPENLNRIVDFLVNNKHPALLSSELYKLDLQPSHLEQIAKTPDMKDGSAYWRSESPHKIGVLNHKNVNPAIQDLLLQNTNAPEILSSIAHSTHDPDLIQRTWDKSKNIAGHGDVAHKWIDHKETPTNILDQLFTQAQTVKASSGGYPGYFRDLVVHPKASEFVRNFAISHESPTIRSMAAQMLNPTSEQIMRGLKDPKKEVREIWAKRETLLQPEHFKMLLKDRAPSIRAMVYQNPALPADVIDGALKTEKDTNAQNVLLKHPNISSATLVDAYKKTNNDKVLRHPNLTAEHFDKLFPDVMDLNNDAHRNLYQRLWERENVLPQTIERAYNGALKALPNASPDQQRQLWTAAKNLSIRPGAPQHLVEHFIDNIPDEPSSLINDLLSDDSDTRRRLDVNEGAPSVKISAQLLDKIAQKFPLTDNPYENARWFSHPNANKTKTIAKILQDPNSPLHGTLANAANLTADQSRHLLRTSNNVDVVTHLLSRHSDLSSEDLDKLLERAAGRNDVPQTHYTAIARHPNAHQPLIEKMYQSSDLKSKLAAVRSDNAPLHVIKDAAKHDDPGIRTLALDKLSLHEPDDYNAAKNGYSIEIHPAIEKLKNLKGLIQDAGGSVHKHKLPNNGQGLHGQLFDGQGNVTEHSIEKFIGSLPKFRVNVTHREWSGCQRHDSTVPQNVYQVNLTNDMIRQLKEQGLYDTFTKMHQSSFRSGHPVDKHSLGWIRVDESHFPQSLHGDEVQSDFSQGSIRQIEHAKESGNMSPQDADKYIDHLKKINKIVSGPFKNTNHMLFSAFHEIARKKGAQGTTMDHMSDQMQQSGMSTHKDAPGYFQMTYKQLPEEVGYTSKPKKEVMPKTKAPETHVQYRKLIKSVDFIKFLLTKLEK